MEEITAMTNRSSEFCFKKDDFMADNFSVDKFVSEYRKQTSLENIKEDLSLFLKVLHTAMVELINRDYTDFVNLSTNLVGLDKSIKNLCTPLRDVKSKVSNVLSDLDVTLTALDSSMQKRSSIQKSKTMLHQVISVLGGIENIERQNIKPLDDSEPLSADVIERVATEYSRIQFHMNQNNAEEVLKSKERAVNEIEKLILQHLDASFANSLATSDTVSLYRVLRVYSTIEKVSDVENKFRSTVVRPYMTQVINENFVNREGIDSMYNQVLKFIPEKCGLLLEVTRGGRKKGMEVLKEYDFLVNAVWPEIVICLECVAPVIFAPGNPAQFHKNYTSSMKFLDEFEHSCCVQTSVQRLRCHSAYKSFMGRWNLDVYFEIRFQEIGGTFETVLMNPFGDSVGEERYLLHVSSGLVKALKHCWAPDVYIKPLCHKFWKLTLQLLSRFHYWMDSTVLKGEENRRKTLSENQSDVKDPMPVMRLVLLVHDVEMLILYIPQIFSNIIAVNFGKNSSKADSALQECLTAYRTVPHRISEIIVSRLTVLCTQHLKLITDIPRLYRKTNRETPTKPSNYVSMVLVPLSSFLSEIESINVSEWKTKWTEDVITCVIEQCFSMTTDVLTSVKKMEDSLKRLKKVREKSSGQSVSGAVSDDDKIRQQLVLDVEFLGSQIEKYGISRTHKSFKKLEDLVLSAARTGVAL